MNQFQKKEHVLRQNYNLKRLTGFSNRLSLYSPAFNTFFVNSSLNILNFNFSKRKSMTAKDIETMLYFNNKNEFFSYFVNCLNKYGYRLNAGAMDNYRLYNKRLYDYELNKLIKESTPTAFTNSIIIK